MARLALAFAAAALLGAAGVRAAEEPTFTSCKTDNDCVSDANADLGQTTCSIFSQYDWTDNTDPANPVNHRVQWGFCTQCRSDCDCGVNEWCSAALKPPTSSWWTATDETQAGAAWVTQQKQTLASFQAGNYKGIGKCVVFGDADAEAERIGMECDPHLTMANVDNSPEHGNYAATCGFVSDWQPEYAACTKGEGGADCASGDQRTKNPGWNTPGVCAGLVSNQQVVGCSSAGITWSGSCVNKQCQVCKDGNMRCSNQRCIGGKWEKYLASDETPRTINANVFAQLEAALLAFLSLILGIGCLSCLATARAAKNMKDAAEA